MHQPKISFFVTGDWLGVDVLAEAAIAGVTVAERPQLARGWRPVAGKPESRKARKAENMHPWHDPYIDEAVLETAFPVVIEIPKGSKNKYELDKETGLLRLDRVLHSAVYYPADYGFIPRTFCDDGDPLDALVLSQEPVYPLTLVQARAIGVMRMRDEKGVDDKIIAVSVSDPAVSDYRDQVQLPQHVMREVQRFFEDYKALEQKKVVVEDLLGPAEALQVIREALDGYRKLRREKR